MAFIGNNLGSVLTEVRTVDTMVGDGIVTTLILSKTPGSVNNVEVFDDGVFQSPNEDFTLLENILCKISINDKTSKHILAVLPYMYIFVQ